MQRNPLRRIERMFEEFEDEFSHARMGFGAPAVDLAEEDGEFVVTCDLPGFDSGDIDLRVTDHTLHIHAEHVSEAEEEEGHRVPIS